MLNIRGHDNVIFSEESKKVVVESIERLSTIYSG